jgi:hypothetical protein
MSSGLGGVLIGHQPQHGIVIEVVDGGAPGLAVADRPAQVVVGFVDRGVLATAAVRSGSSVWELPMPLMVRQSL